MQGGAWDGVEIVSKSGAFGPPTLWHDLLVENGLMSERIES
jgi:D-threonate/D-erythronate kinase